MGTKNAKAKVVVLPEKIHGYIGNAKDHYKCRHNILAYTLHRISVDKKEMTYEQVMKVAQGIYFGYKIK